MTVGIGITETQERQERALHTRQEQSTETCQLFTHLQNSNLALYFVEPRRLEHL